MRNCRIASPVPPLRLDDLPPDIAELLQTVSFLGVESRRAVFIPDSGVTLDEMLIDEPR